MRAAITLSISVGLLGFLLLGGCSGGPLPVGVFKGQHNLDTRPDADPVVTKQLARVVLKIGEDGKADLEDGGLPYDGQASRHGSTLDFEILAISGINIEKQPANVPRNLTFKILDDGNLEYGDVRMVRQP